MKRQNIMMRDLITNIINAKNKFLCDLKLKKTKNIKYQDSDYLNLLSIMGIYGTCAEDTSNSLNLCSNVPTSDSLLKEIKKFKHDEIETQFNGIIEKQLFKLFPKMKKNKRYSVTAIIDEHEQETYSKEKKVSNNIRGGKHKNGTNYFFHYVTIMVLIEGKILTLGLEILTRDSKLSDVVIKLVKKVQKYFDIELLLLDRGFRDVTIFNGLEYLQIPILMPCVKDNKTKKIFEEKLSKKRYGKINFSITNNKKETALVNLIMIKIEDKQFGFYSTIRGKYFEKAKYYVELYMQRWQIETGYRMQNQFLPKTTSINFNVRYFYFFYAIVMHNIWLILNYLNKFNEKITVFKMKLFIIIDWVCKIIGVSPI